MMKSFTEFAGKVYESNIETPEKTVVFCWGRFNPPTRGHEKVFKEAYKKAQEENASFYLFTSQTADDDKNPLDYVRKIKTLEKYFPHFTSNIVKSQNIRTLFDAVRALVEKEFKRGWLIVGEDRLEIFQKQMRDYFSEDIDITVESAGDRYEGDDPEDIGQISGQMLRGFARKGELDQFIKGSPKAAKKAAIENVFYDIRRRYGLNGGKKSEPVEIATTEERERFFRGAFSEGDKVLHSSTNRIGEIKAIGSNYLSVLFLGEEKAKKIWPHEAAKI